MQQVLVGGGFTHTDMDQMLKEANISKGNFNHFFNSKQDLLLAILDFESKKLFSKLESLFEDSVNPLASLNNFLDWKLENYKYGSAIARFGTEFVDKEIQLKKKIKKIYGVYVSYIARLLEDAVIRNQLFKNTPIKELANFIVYSLEGGNLSISMTTSKEQFRDLNNMIKRTIRSYRNLDN